MRKKNPYKKRVTQYWFGTGVPNTVFAPAAGRGMYTPRVCRRGGVHEACPCSDEAGTRHVHTHVGHMGMYTRHAARRSLASVRLVRGGGAEKNQPLISRGWGLFL